MRARPPLRCVSLSALRRAKGLTDEEVAESSGVSPKMVGHYQRDQEPKPPVMERIVTSMGYEAGAEEPVTRALERVCRDTEEPLSPVDPSADERRAIARFTLQAGLALAEAAEERVVRFVRARRAHRARQRADRLWETLAGCGSQRRRSLVESSEEHQRWYVAERLAHESAKVASHNPKIALELAELGLCAAELSPGTNGWRSRITGYCGLFVANAHRVQGQLHEADAAFVRAEKLWEAGAAADPGLLAAWRLPDRKASLRRDQRRFEEALKLHDEALLLGPEAAGRILLNKVATLEQMGEAERAVETLREAEPHVEAGGEPGLLFALRFNRAAILCDLGRAAEAERLLPRVRALALELGQDLHLIRLRWLSGRVHAGLGRTEEAVVALEQVRRDFADHHMAYDCALASVKLAALYLGQGRTAEVKTLARWMEQVFRELDVDREALAALKLFWEAVQHETATAGLAERLFRYLQRARHDPELRFEE